MKLKTRLLSNVDMTIWLCWEILARAIIVVAATLIYKSLHPFERLIAPDEWKNYIYPFAEYEAYPPKAVGFVTVLLISVIISIGAMSLMNLKNYPLRAIGIELLCLFLGLSLSDLLGVLTCELVKRLYGRLRPDFLSRCFNEDEIKSFQGDNFASLEGIPDCSSGRSQHILDDGRMSFPSEHSALGFCTFYFLALWAFYILSKFKRSGALRLVIPGAILVYPVVVAVSRTSDYRHHGTDVLAGSFIGVGLATGCFLLYFPLTIKPIILDFNSTRLRTENDPADLEEKRPLKNDIHVDMNDIQVLD